jgi:hypothetical protein
MQESLASLQRLLADQHRLELDVIRAVGSGSKNQIEALARHWWNGAESVKSVREIVTEPPQQLAAAPDDRKRD